MIPRRNLPQMLLPCLSSTPFLSQSIDMILLRSSSSSKRPFTFCKKLSFWRWITSFVLCCIDYRHTSSLPVHGEASSKTEVYRERFLLLLQRTSRADLFSRPSLDAEKSLFENCEVGFPVFEKKYIIWIFLSVLKSCSFWVDIFNPVSSCSNWKEMGDGCDITVGRWTFLLGRPFSFCWDWFVQCNILFVW